MATNGIFFNNGEIVSFSNDADELIKKAVKSKDTQFHKEVFLPSFADIGKKQGEKLTKEEYAAFGEAMYNRLMDNPELVSKLESNAINKFSQILSDNSSFGKKPVTVAFAGGDNEFGVSKIKEVTDLCKIATLKDASRGFIITAHKNPLDDSPLFSIQRFDENGAESPLFVAPIDQFLELVESYDDIKEMLSNNHGVIAMRANEQVAERIEVMLEDKAEAPKAMKALLERLAENKDPANGLTSLVLFSEEASHEIKNASKLENFLDRTGTKDAIQKGADFITERGKDITSKMREGIVNVAKNARPAIETALDVASIINPTARAINAAYKGGMAAYEAVVAENKEQPQEKSSGIPWKQLFAFAEKKISKKGLGR